MNIWVVFRVEYGSNMVFGWVVKSVLFSQHLAVASKKCQKITWCLFTHKHVTWWWNNKSQSRISRAWEEWDERFNLLNNIYVNGDHHPKIWWKKTVWNHQPDHWSYIYIYTYTLYIPVLDDLIIMFIDSNIFETHQQPIRIPRVWLQVKCRASCISHRRQPCRSPGWLSGWSTRTTQKWKMLSGSSGITMDLQPSPGGETMWKPWSPYDCSIFLYHNSDNLGDFWVYRFTREHEWPYVKIRSSQLSTCTKNGQSASPMYTTIQYMPVIIHHHPPSTSIHHRPSSSITIHHHILQNVVTPENIYIYIHSIVTIMYIYNIHIRCIHFNIYIYIKCT